MEERATPDAIGVGEATIAGKGRTRRSIDEGAVVYHLRHSFLSLMPAEKRIIKARRDLACVKNVPKAPSV
jgi:hypothetical protein